MAARIGFYKENGGPFWKWVLTVLCRIVFFKLANLEFFKLSISVLGFWKQAGFRMGLQLNWQCFEVLEFVNFRVCKCKLFGWGEVVGLVWLSFGSQISSFKWLFFGLSSSWNGLNLKYQVLEMVWISNIRFVLTNFNMNYRFVNWKHIFPKRLLVWLSKNILLSDQSTSWINNGLSISGFDNLQVADSNLKIQVSTLIANSQMSCFQTVNSYSHRTYI